MNIKAAVVTVSDRASLGEREDISGPTAVRLLEEAGVQVLETAVVHDVPPAFCPMPFLEGGLKK